ncbi:MAG: lipid-A-disaccharide synthase [Planctomycetaceae bacterium]|nr:lipid-A-disaccharide synthase [Planctomycetaceae bacterium]
MQIFFSAGEASGDQHAAHLIQELRHRHPELQFTGFGGPEMAQNGCHLLFELTQLAVMGFLRVIPLLARFRKLVIQAEQWFDDRRPDAVVLVDFPGFNWWIAQAAKKRGIPVFYYLPPQLWAWAPWRIRRVRKWVDHVICSLPFEFDWYRSRGVSAVWVGHPFFDEVAARRMDESLVQELRSRETGSVTVGILPGSRNHEVDRNFPVMLQVMRNLSAGIPRLRWIVGAHREEHRTKCQQLQEQSCPDADVTYFVGRTPEVIEAADCCLMVSGSISLELLARRTPGIVLYRVPAIGRFFARFLMNCRFITLTNLIADREVMPEYISSGNPASDIEKITNTLRHWVQQPAALQEKRSELSALAQAVAITGATQRTAEFLLNSLGCPPTVADCEATAA